MQKLIYSVVIVAVSFLLYGTKRKNEFVWTDAKLIHALDEQFQAESSSEDFLKSVWQPVKHKMFEPMAPTIWTLGGVFDPGWSEAKRASRLHSISLMTHTLSSIAVYLILAVLLAAQVPALLGSLVFLGHPMQTEALVTADGYRFVLGGMFALYSIWLYLQFTEKRALTRTASRTANNYYLLGSICFILALFSSAGYVVTPLVAWLTEKLLPKKYSLLARKTPAWPLAAWVLLAMPQIFWTLTTQNTKMLSEALPFWIKPAVAGDSVGFYLSKAIVPYMIGPDYGRSPTLLMSVWWGPWTWLIPVTLFSILFLGKKRDKSALRFAGLVFLAALLPYLGLAYFESQVISTVSNRYAYFAVFAMAIALGFTFAMPKKAWHAYLGIAWLMTALWTTGKDLPQWIKNELIWERTVKTNPQSPKAHQWLGEKAEKTGDLKLALDHFEIALTSNHLNPDLHYGVGIIKEKLGDALGAESSFEHVVSLNSEARDAYAKLGALTLKRGEKEKALSYLTQYAALGGKDIASLVGLGKAYADLNRHEEAIRTLSEVVTHPDFTLLSSAETGDIHAKLGLSMVKAGRHLEARSELEKAEKTGAVSEELANIYFAAGELDLAKASYLHAIEQGVRSPTALLNLAEIQLQKGEPSRALTHIGDILKDDTGNLRAMALMGQAYFNLRQYRSATDTLKRVISLDPNHSQSYFYLAEIARWQAKEVEAIKYYQEALAKNDKLPEARLRLGNLLLKQGRPEEAKIQFEEALKLDPHNPKLQYGLRKSQQSNTTF